MENVFTFHHSCMGHLHVVKDIVCQDDSLSYQDDSCKIIVVSDGHGAASCCRSDVGSKVACTVAMDYLKSFATSMTEIWAEYPEELENFSREKNQEPRIRTLCTSMLAKWHQDVLKNLEEKPLTEEEYERSGNLGAQYREGKKLSHVFGATLLGALWMERYLVLLQQGDGRCNVFYADGTFDQPIPWDARCHENVTTSLCDDDAHLAIRFSVIDLTKKSVIAVFLGSDGVEDSYRTMEGNYNFYKQQLIEMHKMNFDPEKLSKYFQKFLPEFSKSGSGDDVSVAGILLKKEMVQFVPTYEKDLKAYELTEVLKLVSDKVNSMERKHSFLEENRIKSHEAFTEYRKYHADYSDYVRQRDEIQEKLDKINGIVREKKPESLDLSEKNTDSVIDSEVKPESTIIALPRTDEEWNQEQIQEDMSKLGEKLSKSNRSAEELTLAVQETDKVDAMEKTPPERNENKGSTVTKEGVVLKESIKDFTQRPVEYENFKDETKKDEVKKD